VSPAIDDPRAELARRCDAIEESYEFMLAYASRGIAAGPDREPDVEIRGYLERFDAALTGLGDVVTSFVDGLKLEPAVAYRGYVDLLNRDARDAQAALRVVLAQRSLTSQIVDNLNASVHVRTLLTDLFLIDEILKGQRTNL
jgi:hypothetical protein